MNDNTILLGIIVILQGVYVWQNAVQSRKLKEWTDKMEKFIEEFIEIRTEHKYNKEHGGCGRTGG